MATLISFSACNNNDSADNESTSTPVNSNAINNSITDSNSTITTPSVPNSVQQPAGGNVVLNPPHGQPGHNCDIEVGQPLNSASKSSNTAQPIMTTPAQSPTVVPNSPSAPLPSGIAPNNGQVKLNPAHGLPGHRCDIAVGAAL